MEQNAFHLKMRLDHVGIITIDVPGEKMNTLKAEFAGQITAIAQPLFPVSWAELVG